MTIGIGRFRTARDLMLDRMLLQPFRGVEGSRTTGTREAHR
jgi:hypothetical protein